MTVRDGYERLAERGEPRGAEVVLRASRSSVGTSTRSPIRWWIVAAGVAAVLAVLVGTRVSTDGEEDGGEQLHTAPRPSGPAPPATSDGPLFGEVVDATLILMGQNGELVALSADSATVMQFPDGSAGIRDASIPLARSGDELVFISRRGVAAQAVDLATPPRSLAGDARFLPSGREGRLWLLGDDDSVQEIDASDQVTVAPTLPPAGFGAELAVGGQLLVVEGGWGVPPTPRRASLWDPQRNVITREFSHVLPYAASGDRMALGVDCQPELPNGPNSGDRCAGVEILDVASGEEVTIDLGGIDVGTPSPGHGASFSPDGLLLALWPVHSSGGRLVVVDARTGQIRVDVEAPVAQSGLGVSLVTWAPDGSRLFAFTSGVESMTLATIEIASGVRTAAILAAPLIEAHAMAAVPAQDGPDLAVPAEGEVCDTAQVLSEPSPPEAKPPCRIAVAP